MLVTSWGHQLGWDEISVGWLWAGAAGGSSRTAQHQGTSDGGSGACGLGQGAVTLPMGWAGCRCESPSAWPAVVMVVVAAMGPWAGILEARGACWRCVCVLAGGMLQQRVGLP